MFQSLQARLTTLFAAFVLLVVVSVGAMMWGSATQRQDAALINLAGRQRMLAQQMARLAFEDDGEGLAAGTLLEAERLFDQTQRALLDGGAAPYPSGAPVTLPAARDPAIRSALAQTGLAWNDFRALLDQPQQAARARPLPASARAAIETSASTLVERADAVVRLYELNATAKLNRLRAIQVVFLISALALLGLGAWVTRRSLLAPLHDLSRAATRLGDNDLDSPVQVAGPREVQALSASFDAMRVRLKVSRSQLLDLTATLEARVDRRTRELNALNEVSREIAAQLDTGALLGSVTDKARALLDADSAMVCLLDDSRQQLQLKAASGARAAEPGIAGVSTAALAGAVLASQQALLCSNAHCVGGCGLLADGHAASHLVAPLRIGDHVIGALCASSGRPNHFSAESTDVATKLANTAAVALQNARLYAQAEKVAVLEERNRIAADMHDGLGQTLSYLGLVTDHTVELLAQGEEDEALANLDRTRTTINQATRQVRESIQQLMDGAPRERKLASLLEETVHEFEGRYQVDIRWQLEDDAGVQAPRAVTEQVVNVARETLENACRHAHPQSICVQLGRENGNGQLTVTDDGCGFDPAAQALQANGHFGLRVMRARAAHIGGELLLESTPGAGTRVTLLFPVGEGSQ